MLNGCCHLRKGKHDVRLRLRSQNLLCKPGWLRCTSASISECRYHGHRRRADVCFTVWPSQSHRGSQAFRPFGLAAVEGCTSAGAACFMATAMELQRLVRCVRALRSQLHSFRSKSAVTCLLQHLARFTCPQSGVVLRCSLCLQLCSSTACQQAVFKQPYSLMHSAERVIFDLLHLSKCTICITMLELQQQRQTDLRDLQDWFHDMVLEFCFQINN